jgi:hypothetical protein
MNSIEYFDFVKPKNLQILSFLADPELLETTKCVDHPWL